MHYAFSERQSIFYDARIDFGQGRIVRDASRKDTLCSRQICCNNVACKYTMRPAPEIEGSSIITDANDIYCDFTTELGVRCDRKMWNVWRYF